MYGLNHSPFPNKAITYLKMIQRQKDYQPGIKFLTILHNHQPSYAIHSDMKFSNLDYGIKYKIQFYGVVLGSSWGHLNKSTEHIATAYKHRCRVKLPTKVETNEHSLRFVAGLKLGISNCYSCLNRLIRASTIKALFHQSKQDASMLFFRQVGIQISYEMR